MDPKVDPLKKITLSVMAGTQPETMDLAVSPSTFAFIYGIGTDGLTPFEFQLADKSTGDEIIVHINCFQITEIFAHIAAPIPQIPEHIDAIHMKFKIIQITPADNREIVKAMAEISSCGSHCCGH